jgi:murein DD-endopeptidase MepM/ murein hydrolase activator NlpD
MDKISESVGIDGANKPEDVKVIQILLNKNRHLIPGMREIPEDRILGPKTLDVIKAFQTRVVKLRDVDCVIDPDGKTFKTLVKGASPAASAAHANAPAAPCEAPILDEAVSFPLRNRAVPAFTAPPLSRGHHRYFGAPRKDRHGNYRAHAGVDLIAAPGTPVLAVDDGKPIRFSPGFFDVTGALEVEHDNGLVVRYGEVSQVPGLVRAGVVQRGQVVAYVQENSAGTAMLHIEFYAGTKQGSLSQPGANAFNRRGDLVNGTNYLMSANTV